MRANLLWGKGGFTCRPWRGVAVLFSPSPDLLRCAFLLRLQDQGTPSLAYPFDGVAIHWMATFFRLTPVRAFAELPLSTGQRLPAHPQAGSYGDGAFPAKARRKNSGAARAASWIPAL